MEQQALPPPAPAGAWLFRLVCRILGHRWRFLHAHPEAGKVYRCQRCGTESRFIR